MTETIGFVILFLLVLSAFPGAGAGIAAAITTLKSELPGLLGMVIAFIFMMVVLYICNNKIDENKKWFWKNKKREDVIYLCKIVAMIIVIIAGVRAFVLIMPKVLLTLQ